MLTTEIRDHWILDNNLAMSDEGVSDYMLINALNAMVKNYDAPDDTFAFHRPNYNKVKKENFGVEELKKYRLTRSENYINRSQSWIGYICELRDKDFSAKLYDLNDKTTYELAEFNKSDISRGDLELVKLGAAFYWYIGYSYENGQVSKKSSIRFKRVVNMNNETIDKLKNRAQEINNQINWE